MITQEPIKPGRSKSSKKKKSHPQGGQNRNRRPSSAKPSHRPQSTNNSQNVDLEKLQSFANLGLGNKSLTSVNRVGFETPSEIQQKFIPAALSGRDCVGQARTGTGKTAAFLLPIFEQNFQSGNKRALILAPTRELAMQIAEESKRLAGHGSLKTTVVYGGSPINRQIASLKGRPEIVVATPGRLLDHATRRTINLNEFSIVVMDEVDRMFDMGFRKDISKILSQCKQREQTLFLSATMPKDIMQFADRFLDDPIRVATVSDEDEASVETLDQRYYVVKEQRKLPLLFEVLKREKPVLGMIFTRTKRGAERLGKQLQQRGYDATYIHGDLPQSRRKKAIDSFRAGKVQLLVATDVMGRGIDVPGVSHVINYHVPENPKDYLHRVGRTGRMNAVGKAIMFVTPNDGPEVTAIEMACNRLLERDEIPGFNTGL
jgi:ATP-dependent RNA helicase DeaD